MRKSIFEIAAQNVDMASEVNRLIVMATEEDVLLIDSYPYKTLFDYVDQYCFKTWAHRGHFVDVDDFLSALEFDDLQNAAEIDTEAFLTLIELIYNFWQLSQNMFFNSEKRHRLQWCGNYYHLKNVMDDLLGEYNHKAYIGEESSCVLVIEDKAEVTSAAEIMPTSSLALDIIKYNHRTLKGNITLKKKILLELAAHLEPNRKQLHSINSNLEDDIFFMLNNLNIRHNNRSKKDKNYKEYVAKMRTDRLEKWYDELYQMILLAFLQLDNVARSESVKNLKGKIIEGQNSKKN